MNRGLTWGTIIERHARKRQNKLALIQDEKKLTYGELLSCVNQMANLLMGLGTKKGDRVCIYLPNHWQHIISHFGVLKAGGVVVPFNVMYKAREIKYMIQDSDAKTIITTGELYRFVKEIKEETGLRNVIVTGANQSGEMSFDRIFMEPTYLREAPHLDEREDLCLIQYTSGTTGEPKGAMLTYHNILSNVRTTTNLYDFDENDTQIVVLPLFHSFGIFSVYYSIFTGGMIVLVERFDAENVLSLIQKYKATAYYCVPPMLLGFLAVKNPERFDLSSLRHCLCGAAVMPVEVMQSVRSLLGVEVVDGYGCTEAYGFITTPYKGLYKHGSIGLPSPLQDVRLVDNEDKDVPRGEVGEIVTRGPIIMRGYWNKPKETGEAFRGGWFHTGDLARMDEDGYFYIVGRKKELIISSGYNIYPKEIEEVLYQHPKVADAAVIGVPHEYKGETVKAYVVLRGGERATEEEIIEYCRNTMAVFKAPTVVEFTERLPRTASGKVLKRLLLESSK